MPDTTGFGEAAAQAALTNIISGGATVHLIGSGQTANYSDTGTEIVSKSDTQILTAEADWTITTPADFSGVTTLAPSIELDFGTPDIGTTEDIVIQNQANPGLWIVASEASPVDLTGAETTIPADQVLHKLGNV